MAKDNRLGTDPLSWMKRTEASDDVQDEADAPPIEAVHRLIERYTEPVTLTPDERDCAPAEASEASDEPEPSVEPRAVVAAREEPTEMEDFRRALEVVVKEALAEAGGETPTEAVVVVETAVEAPASRETLLRTARVAAGLAVSRRDEGDPSLPCSLVVRCQRDRQSNVVLRVYGRPGALPKKIRIGSDELLAPVTTAVLAEKGMICFVRGETSELRVVLPTTAAGARGER
jgi:hypothetical protein